MLKHSISYEQDIDVIFSLNFHNILYDTSYKLYFSLLMPYSHHKELFLFLLFIIKQ